MIPPTAETRWADSFLGGYVWLSWYRYDHTDKKEIDSPVVGGRLLTPIRDVLESLCYIVLWDDASKNVKIIPPAENKITVRFNYNYGIEKSSDKPYFERVSEGEAVTLPIPSRTGFVFDAIIAAIKPTARRI